MRFSYLCRRRQGWHAFYYLRGLAWHSAALKPRTCGPANLELCSDEVKKKIEGFMVPWMQFSMFTNEIWFCGILLRPEVDMNRWAFASVCCSFAPSRQCLQIGLRARSAMPFELWKRRCEKILMSICHIMLLWFEKLILMLLARCLSWRRSLLTWRRPRVSSKKLFGFRVPPDFVDLLTHLTSFVVRGHVTVQNSVPLLSQDSSKFGICCF